MNEETLAIDVFRGKIKSEISEKKMKAVCSHLGFEFK